MTSQKRSGREIHGILVLDKPSNQTSNQVLQQAKRIFSAAKAGHTGSLDPLATGMLPICFGVATRVSSYLLDATKRYSVKALLGQATDTGDSHGKVIAKAGRLSISEQEIRKVLQRFLGKSEQVPPMYSALKHQGRRLYELARQGIEVERASRTVQVFDLQLVKFDWPNLEFTVSCSKGTYVRTLVEDISRCLGTLGHVVGLRRTVVEPFFESDMVKIETLQACYSDGPDSLAGLLLPVDSPLSSWPKLVVQSEFCNRLTNGRAVPALPEWPRSFVRLYDPEEVFFGIGIVELGGSLVPRRIFPGLSAWC